MLNILDKNLRLTVLNIQSEPNVYYISLGNITKSVIETTNIDNDILLKIYLQGDCTVEELTTIIDKFSGYILSTNNEIEGIRIDTDPNEILEGIGFKLENNAYLYRKANRKLKRG